MTARRFLVGCAAAAAITTCAVLAVTAWTIHNTGRTHRRARGMR